MAGPDVSVVVVSYNTRDLLRTCLGAAVRAADRISHEVIVVDNASPDGSADMVRREFPNVTLVANSRNLFYTAAANQGLALAHGRFVLILNADVTFSDGTFGRLYDYLERHEEVGAVSPSLVDGLGRPEACFWRTRTYESFLLNYTFLRHLFPSRTRQLNGRIEMAGESRAAVREVEMVIDMSLLARREALQQIGFYDEDFKLYFCDDDLSLRLRNAGWRLMFLGDAQNLHHRHSSVSQQPELWRIRMFRHDALVYARKHFGRTRAAILAPLMRATTRMRALRVGIGSIPLAQSPGSHQS